MKPAKTVALSFAVSISAILFGPANLANAQEAASAEVAVISEQYPAPSPDTFGQTQFVLSGNPIVPPRDYSKGTMLPSKDDYQAKESGRIYDVVFAGIEAGKMQFEVRGYSIDSLDFPASGQTIEFPADQRQVTISDLTFNIDEATAGSITYTVQPLK
ncbi:hypothetical protein RI570_01320 [Brucella pseudogrignonensis]|uniref:hypothetical protein n=1 Tax=Brucella pseudogrignonensis TaxID=419475 RepID=UPI0028B5ED63|nr:hypothetical protein [Brucella pseudogrignonensis]MDT6938792.1 hypothetical protein [Brucella pseudogrignonensis]